MGEPNAVQAVKICSMHSVARGNALLGPASRTSVGDKYALVNARRGSIVAFSQGESARSTRLVRL